MGKRGKAARKRRRENEVDVAALACKLIKKSDATNHQQQDENTDGELLDTTIGHHGISDESLEMTVATLDRLCGLVDPTTGKLALKDKRYRSLRKVLYELQSSIGAGTVQASSTPLLITGNSGNNSSLGSENAHALPPQSLSTSKITREISAQIENGAWEMAVATLRNVRMRQEEYSKQADAKTEKGITSDSNSYLRPKLGAVQRWVRQIDAAGTDDPLALGVLDAILRVVAPEAIKPVEKIDMDRATWARLGVNGSSSDGNGKHVEEGSVRLFPPFDRRPKNDGICKKDDLVSSSQMKGKADPDVVDALVSCMEVGEDGIRRVSNTQSKVHRDALFRQCGFEKGGDRKPPNKYDLELVTTATIAETQSIESGKPLVGIGTCSGEYILRDDSKGLPVVKTPLPYVQDSFLLENVLSPAECDRLIAAAETAGYKPDEPLAGQPGASILAHACVWVVDHNLERTIFERVKQFLPFYEHPKQKGDGSSDIETLEPLGLNRRFRFYRYVPGRYYRPHIDGAWPPSGLDRKGHYRYDVCDEANKNGLQFVEKEEDNSSQTAGVDCQASPGPLEDKPEQEPSPGKLNNNNTRRQMSRLTFLIYLNDDFEGGHTTFLLPAKEKEGTLNAFPVNPVRGGILVFPHGTCAAPLHEGSPVLQRCKYVVRTEVQYYL